ncbi:hypothetical protein D9M69_615630 [compost metagenome]
MRPIVSLGAVEPGEVLDVGPRQPLPGSREVLLDAQQVDSRSSRGRAERLPRNLSTEGMVLQVEEPRCALDIGEGFRASDFLPLEDLPAGERPFELANELLEVVLNHPVQRHQIAVDVVQHLDGCRLWSEKEERSATGENLDVALMGREKRNEASRQAALAAHPGDDRLSHYASLLLYE